MGKNVFPFTNVICSFKTAIKQITPYKDKFNRLVVNNATTYDVAADMLDTIKAISESISSYSTWKKEAFETINNKSAALAELKNAMSILEAAEEKPTVLHNIDARKILDLDLLNGEIIEWITAIWFTFSEVQITDTCLHVYMNLFIKEVSHLAIILREANKVFGLISPIDTSIPILWETIPLEGDLIDHMSFGLCDYVVSFSEEEKLEIERKKQAEIAKAKELEEIENAKKKIEGYRDTIVNSYETLKNSGNLSNFKIKDNYLELLKNPKSVSDSETIASLWRFLMAMSNSVRYMPGDVGSDKDRINGSFVELDQDILRYKSHFTIYLYEYAMNHNDIVNALKFFDDSNGKIVAQYVDSKEYVEEYRSDPEGPKMIHLFVM